MSKSNSKTSQENKLEKLTPYIFPTIALLIVVFLSFRWYNMRTQRDPEITQFAEGVEIENLSEEELDDVLQGVDDRKTVDMVGNDDARGQIRYEFKDGRVLFTVNAELAELENGQYQVWLKSVEKDDYRKAFTLEYGKAGYYGSAALSEEVVPFEVVVSKEMNPADDQLEEVVLTGVISKE